MIGLLRIHELREYSRKREKGGLGRHVGISEREALAAEVAASARRVRVGVRFRKTESSMPVAASVDIIHSAISTAIALALALAIALAYSKT